MDNSFSKPPDCQAFGALDIAGQRGYTRFMSDFDFLLQIRAFHRGFTIQKEAVSDFWRRADDILAGSKISLKKLPPRYLTLRHNYFSVLFLTVYDILGVRPERMRLYAAINHCMRTWVTACDNLLDN